MDDATMLAELQPTAERLVDRHLGMAKEWFPHVCVPKTSSGLVSLDERIEAAGTNLPSLIWMRIRRIPLQITPLQ